MLPSPYEPLMLRTNKDPQAVKGKAEAVRQDARPNQCLLDIAAQADAREGIRQGLKDLEEGRVRPARKALENFRRNHAIPR
jgi:hypothetical protein